MAKYIFNRYDSEYRTHHNNKHKFLNYKHQIILNKTEHKLYVLNKERVAKQQPQQHFLTFNNIAQQDLKYYFPNSKATSPGQIFITDTDCKYITSVIQVTSGSSTQIRASHTFHLSNSSNYKQSIFYTPNCSSPEEIASQTSMDTRQNTNDPDDPPPRLKTTAPPKVYPDLHDILTIGSPLKHQGSSPINKPTEEIYHNVLTPNKVHYYQTSPSKRTTTIMTLDTIDSPPATPPLEEGPPKYDTTFQQQPAVTMTTQCYMSPAINTGFLSTGAIHKNGQQTHQITNPQYDPKDKIIEEARKATQILIEQNTQLRNDLIILKLQYESLSSKDRIDQQNPFQPALPRLPDSTTPPDEQTRCSIEYSKDGQFQIFGNVLTLLLFIRKVRQTWSQIIDLYLVFVLSQSYSKDVFYS